MFREGSWDNLEISFKLEMHFESSPILPPLESFRFVSATQFLVCNTLFHRCLNDLMESHCLGDGSFMRSPHLSTVSFS